MSWRSSPSLPSCTIIAPASWTLYPQVKHSFSVGYGEHSLSKSGESVVARLTVVKLTKICMQLVTVCVTVLSTAHHTHAHPHVRTHPARFRLRACRRLQGLGQRQNILHPGQLVRNCPAGWDAKSNRRGSVLQIRRRQFGPLHLPD